MTTGRLLHPEMSLTRKRRAPRVRDRAEWLLLLITVFMIILVTGFWVRDSIAGPVEPVIATITVQSGDTLWNLAKQYGDPDQYILARVDALAKANGLKRGDVLRVGQTLTIPVTNRSAKLYYGGKLCSRLDQEPGR